MAANEGSSSGKPEKKKTVAANSRLADAQKRAQSMAASGKKPVSPGTFFKEAWEELKKTTWPTRPVLWKSVTVVLVLVIATAIFVGGLDLLLTRIASPLFNAGQ